MAIFKYTAQRGLSLLGDEKGAWMADTTAETLVGSELVTNGDFATDTDWIKSTGWTIASGVASHVAGASGYLQQSSILPPAGTSILVTFTISNITAGGVSIFATWGVRTPYVYANGTYTFSLVVGADTNLYIYALSTFAGDIDNVSVRLAVPDLSTANNGLGVYGSITKSAVATGAGLMGYSGFSASNYLEQPYNSDLDFGTGDFCFMGWSNQSPTTSYEMILSRGYYSGGWVGALIQLFYRPDGALRFIVSDDGGTTIDSATTSNVYDDSLPHHVAALRRGNTFHVYVDGALVISVLVNNAAGSLNNANASLSFGIDQGGASYANNNNGLSLWRAFAYAPTAAQIKAIYNKEKHLFKKYSTYTQEGVQRTLTIPLQSADRSRSVVKNETVTLSGKRVSLVHRNEYDWSLGTDIVHRTDSTTFPLLSELDELVYSTQGSEVFTVDIYEDGTDTAMVMKSTKVADARLSKKDMFTATLKMQESNQ